MVTTTSDQIGWSRNRAESGNLSAQEDVYNTWPRFRADCLPEVAESDVLPLVKPILDHLRDVITGPDHLDFFVAWLAQQVQDPANTTGVAIVLQGKQGVGKNIIFDFYIDNVLGAGSQSNPINGAGFRTAKPSADVFGRSADQQSVHHGGRNPRRRDASAHEQAEGPHNLPDSQRRSKNETQLSAACATSCSPQMTWILVRSNPKNAALWYSRATGVERGTRSTSMI
jgi:hypothetical protein